MPVEDEYKDVLQNIEFTIVSLYRRHPEMTDYAVTRMLETLTNVYKAERTGRPPLEIPLSELERTLVDDVRAVCEWRLGRAEAPRYPGAGAAPPLKPLTVDEMLLCLKRIAKSARTWNKEGGRKGYLDFVSQFL